MMKNNKRLAESSLLKDIDANTVKRYVDLKVIKAPRSAYNFFLSDKRALAKKEESVFSVKDVSGEWKEHKEKFDETYDKFKTMAEEDVKRYHNDLKKAGFTETSALELKNMFSNKKQRVPKKVVTEPAKPKTAFYYFVRETFEDHKKDNASAKLRDFKSEQYKLWEKLAKDDPIRVKYNEVRDKRMAMYNQEMMVYKTGLILYTKDIKDACSMDDEEYMEKLDQTTQEWNEFSMNDAVKVEYLKRAREYLKNKKNKDDENVEEDEEEKEESDSDSDSDDEEEE